jgi:hypothetical protein
MTIQEVDRQERIAALVAETRQSRGKRQDRSRSWEAKLETVRRRRVRRDIERYGFRGA